MWKLLLRLAILGLVGRVATRRVQHILLPASAGKVETVKQVLIDHKIERSCSSVSQKIRNSVGAAPQKIRNSLGAALKSLKSKISRKLRDFAISFQVYSGPFGNILGERGRFPKPLIPSFYRNRASLAINNHSSELSDSSTPFITWERLAIVVALCCVIACALMAFLCSNHRKCRNRKPYMHHDKVIYEWEQFEKAMMMYVAIPEGIGKDDLDIRIEPRQITIGRKGMPAFIREKLYLLVDEGKSSWKFDKHELEICFVKLEPTVWPGLILSHVQEKRR